MGQGVFWRGRWWAIGGGDGSEEGDEGAAAGAAGAAGAGDGAGAQGDAAAALAAATARIAELEAAAGQAESLQARLAELEAAAARVGELEAALAAEREAREQAVTRGLDAHRRALIAAHAGQVVEELVQGATEEALDASVEVAKAAYGRIADLVRTDLAGQQVSGGGGTRTDADLSSLSPLEKIARGLTR